MARFAKQLPIQRITSVIIWFRRQLDDTDLQTILEIYSQAVKNVCLCVCILVRVSLLYSTYLTSVAVLMIGVSQTFNSVAVSAILFGNDQLVTGATHRSILPSWTEV